MKQIIEIEVPDGKKAIWKDNKIVFEDIKPQLPKTWDKFCKLYPIKITEYHIYLDSTITKSGNGQRISKTDKNVLPSLEAAKAHLALMQLHQLRDCYRQGWIPDWNNSMEKRFCIVNKKSNYIISNTAIVSCFLAFQSQELAKEFLDNFKDLIEQARDLI